MTARTQLKQNGFGQKTILQRDLPLKLNILNKPHVPFLFIINSVYRDLFFRYLPVPDTSVPNPSEATCGGGGWEKRRTYAVIKTSEL